MSSSKKSNNINTPLNERIEKARYIATQSNKVVVVEHQGKRIPVMPNPPKHLMPGYSPSVIEEINRGD